MAADVTIVIATYNRPALLACAIKSVMLQSFQNWLLYIVGDACDDKTEEIVAKFEDLRIHYCNLPTRCGEQSGPNSAGIAAANTKYVALLNQDDIWFPNHLELALNKLKETDASFYCAGAVLTAHTHNKVTGRERSIFSLTNRTERTFEEMFYSHPDYLEPASAWVFSKEIFDEIGPWAPAATLYRTPLEDWLLRLWASGAASILSDEVTVIKCCINKGKHWKKLHKDAALYSRTENEQLALSRILEAGKTQKLWDIVESDLAEFKEKAKHPTRHQGSKLSVPFRQLVNAESARSFRQNGHDAFTDFCESVGLRKGQALETLLQRRTGEALPIHESWDEMIRFAKAAFS